MEEIKFTIIIPTRERSDVLAPALKSVLNQDYANFEIIVSDNYSCDDTEKIVASFKSDKVRYINTGKRVGMSQNWEFALDHVTSGWVAIIGDDDALLNNALSKVAELINLTGSKCIRSDTCGFLWPGLNGSDHGTLSIPLKSGWTERKSEIWIEKILSGKAGYANLPQVYNGGFVDFDVLKDIKSKSGRYIHSMNPDLYLGMAIASELPSYVYSMEPFVINGASWHSGGTSAFSSKSSSKNSPSNKFANEDNIDFHHDLPLCCDGKVVHSLQASAYEVYLQSKHLRKINIFEDHQKQLQVILSVNDGIHRESVEAWGEQFAALHCLDLPNAIKSSKGDIFFLKLRKGLRAMFSFLNRYVVHGDTYPLNDVYDAAIVASTIINVKPSRQKMFLEAIKRGIKKLKIAT